MNLGYLVDVSGPLDPAVLTALVEGSYRASKRHPVILLVPRSRREEVERILDDVVGEVGRDVAGVLFKDPETDLDRILSAAQLMSLVIANDECLRGLLGRRRVPYHTPETGVGLLNGCAGGQARTA